MKLECARSISAGGDQRVKKIARKNFQVWYYGTDIWVSQICVGGEIKRENQEKTASKRILW